MADPISTYKSKIGRYPGNNKQWWVAKADTDDPDKNIKQGDFIPDVLDKIFYGNNRAPRGHFILQAFYKDRSFVSGVPNLPVEVVESRPTSVAFYAGRVWYGVDSTVYFSQLLSDKYKAGLCYQEADPTSEVISDLIATDGGVIPIPEAVKIIKLMPHGEGLVIFAENGVWNVTGTSGGFTAVDISVTKISPIGCKSPSSVVETEEGLFWWTDLGIIGMQQKLGQYGPIPGVFDRTVITEDTIQTYYNDILEDAKRQAKGIYDARNNRIMWVYRDDDVGPSQYNRVLLFDLSLGAFYPWKFGLLEDDPTPYIKGVFGSERSAVITNNELIVVGDETVTAVGEDVIAGYGVTQRFPSAIEFFVTCQGKGRFSQIRNTGFVDWEAENSVGVSYDSYVETGYELFDDAMRKKNLTYVFTYLKRTEEGWQTINDQPTLINPSSCYMTVKYDWANSSMSNQWTKPVQVYRPGRFLTNADGTMETGYPIIVTKNKVRGNGKSIQFRFGTNEPGKNFDLHGWSIEVSGNTTP